MAGHYHTKNPESAHDLESWSFPSRGRIFQSMISSGVLLKGTVGYDSRVLIDAFEWENLPADCLLDVGCGYGPIRLSLAAATGWLVEMVNVDQWVVRPVQMNAQRSQITTVSIHSFNVYKTLNEATYVAIASNPSVHAGKEVAHDILTGAFPLLKADGTLTVVIQKKRGAPSAEKKMAKVFGNIEIATKDKGYYILWSTKEAG